MAGSPSTVIERQGSASHPRSARGKNFYDSRWGTRMTGEGIYAEHLDHLFEIAVRKAGYPDRTPHLTTAHFRRPSGPQLEFFNS